MSGLTIKKPLEQGFQLRGPASKAIGVMLWNGKIIPKFRRLNREIFRILAIASVQ
ncbi:MAG TPA: hypothetical protein V6D27_07935 [Vampirovibrionales bacterium]